MTDNMSILAGKIGLVVGVANKRSIAWAIAQAWHDAGATLAFTYQGERLKDNVAELAGAFGADTLILPCDVTRDDEIARVFAEVGGKFGRLHLLLHSVAFAPREALEGDFFGTTREAFRIAHDVSAYSLVALARGAAPLMTDGGSIVAMTYYGSRKVVPRYNVMGVAKAPWNPAPAIWPMISARKKSASTASAPAPSIHWPPAASPAFPTCSNTTKPTPRSNATSFPMNSAPPDLFLASDGAAAITGQVLYVDCGYQIMGM